MNGVHFVLLHVLLFPRKNNSNVVFHEGGNISTTEISDSVTAAVAVVKSSVSHQFSVFLKRMGRKNRVVPFVCCMAKMTVIFDQNDLDQNDC